MKHGDKAKKPAKAKSSGNKAKVAIKSKPAQAVKNRSEARPPIASAATKGARGGPVSVGFSNNVVGAAFKRAVKKYPTAFRRLTD